MTSTRVVETSFINQNSFQTIAQDKPQVMNTNNQNAIIIQHIIKGLTAISPGECLYLTIGQVLPRIL